jgi:hypothetical protein
LKISRFSLVAMVATLNALACREVPTTDVRSWPADRPAADAVARAMAAVIGAPPSLLARCGPQHLLVAYLDAPVDVKPESTRGPDGRSVPVISTAQRTRHTVAAVIAMALWSAMPYGAYDTVTVRLTRRQGFPSGYGPDKGEFTLAPVNEIPHPLVARPIWGPADLCWSVI